MIKTRLASAAAAFMFGLAAIAGTVLTCAAPANATTAASSTQTEEQEPASPKTAPQKPASPNFAPQKPAGPPAGQPFSKNPYPESNPFPGLSGNPYH
jgi:hypothetical protein